MELDLKSKKELKFIDGQLWETKKLIELGRAYVLTIPKAWVEIYCKPDIEGKFRVGVETDGDTLRIKAYKGDEDDKD